MTALAPGLAAVTATVSARGERFAIAVPVTVLGVEIHPTNMIMAHGIEVRLLATPVGDTARYGALRWTSTNPAIVAVDSTGTVRSVALGAARITAVASRDPRLRGESHVVVTCPCGPPPSITVEPSALALAPGDTARLTVRATLPDGTPPDLRFASLDTAIATVSATGLVTARRVGTTVLRVSPVAVPQLVGGATVTVRARP